MTQGKARWLRAATGIVLLLGYFAGLCTLFAFLVTAAAAWQERRESQWPQVPARVQQCDVKQSDLGTPRAGIECAVEVTLEGTAVRSSVHSQTSIDPYKILWELHSGKAIETFNTMRDWVDAHPPGTTLTVHYDPSRHSKVALVETDMPLGGSATPDNLRFTQFLAALSVGLLAFGMIAKRLLPR